MLVGVVACHATSIPGEPQLRAEQVAEDLASLHVIQRRFDQTLDYIHHPPVSDADTPEKIYVLYDFGVLDETVETKDIPLISIKLRYQDGNPYVWDNASA